jgi:hypothetical protein
MIGPALFGWLHGADFYRPVTFLIVPSRGLLGRSAWYDLPPLSCG